MLQRENLPQGVCPETYNLTHPHIVKKIHEAYIVAGAQVIIANTFGANRLKLQRARRTCRFSVTPYG